MCGIANVILSTEASFAQFCVGCLHKIEWSDVSLYLPWCLLAQWGMIMYGQYILFIEAFG
jgi:hypothetical protein